MNPVGKEAEYRVEKREKYIYKKKKGFQNLKREKRNFSIGHNRKTLTDDALYGGNGEKEGTHIFYFKKSFSPFYKGPFTITYDRMFKIISKRRPCQHASDHVRTPLRKASVENARGAGYKSIPFTMTSHSPTPLNPPTLSRENEGGRDLSHRQNKRQHGERERKSINSYHH